MKRFEREYLLYAFRGLLMTTYSQTVIFGHSIHRVSFAVTNVAEGRGIKAAASSS